jgi:hypothetical protein
MPFRSFRAAVINAVVNPAVRESIRRKKRTVGECRKFPHLPLCCHCFSHQGVERVRSAI